MYRKSILAAVLALALATMACGVNINIPTTEIKTGPTQTDTISVPLPDDQEKVTNVTLAFGAGEINLNPGAEDGLISGTATYNVEDFKPEVTINDDAVRIEQGDFNISGIPSFEGNVKNTWDLTFGTAPMNLTISAGAYVGKFELGGLALQEVSVSDGASDVNLSFSEPNLTEMDTFTYETGASDVTITGLANANVDDVIFKSGAGSYTLDFTGELQQDMTVSVESGISSITIIIPEGVSAEVTFEGALSDVNYSGAWEKNNNQYIQTGSGPTITIKVTIGAGNLSLQNK